MNSRCSKGISEGTGVDKHRILKLFLNICVLFTIFYLRNRETETRETHYLGEKLKKSNECINSSEKFSEED